VVDRARGRGRLAEAPSEDLEQSLSGEQSVTVVPSWDEIEAATRSSALGVGLLTTVSLLR